MDIKFNTLCFQSKTINKEVVKKGSALVAAIGSAAQIGTAAESNYPDKLEKELEAEGRSRQAEINMLMDAKARRIQNVITRRINKNKQITIEEISKRTKIPVNQVVSIIYNRSNKYTELRKKFDLVKDKTHVFKPLADSDIKLAQKIVNSASAYRTTDAEDIINLEDYVKILSNNIRSARVKGRWPEDVLQRYAEYFNIFPAYSDMLISALTHNKIMRSITTTENLDLLFASYSNNPDMTENLINELDENGGFKYSVNSVYKIAAVCKDFPELEKIAREDSQLVYWIYNMADEKDNKRFWGDDILKLYQYYQEFPDLTKKLIQDVSRIETYNVDDDKASVKIAESIKKAEEAENTDEEADAEENSVKSNIRKTKPKYTADEIFYILENYKKSPDLVSYLINGKYAGTSLRYDKKYILEVLKEKEEYTNKDLYWKFGHIYSNEKELRKKGIKVYKPKYNNFINML